MISANWWDKYHPGDGLDPLQRHDDYSTKYMSIRIFTAKVQGCSPRINVSMDFNAFSRLIEDLYLVIIRFVIMLNDRG